MRKHIPIKNKLKKLIEMTKDLIIRSSSAEFLIFERQTHDKGIHLDLMMVIYGVNTESYWRTL